MRRSGKPLIDTEAVRGHAASWARAVRAEGKTPSALVTATIPGLCDEVDYLRGVLRGDRVTVPNRTPAARFEMSPKLVDLGDAYGAGMAIQRAIREGA